MEKQLHLREFHESDLYTAIQGDQRNENENMYELPTINKELQQSSVSTAAPNVAMEPKQRQSSWSKPLLLITVLLCLILVLLIIILGIVVYDKYATGNNVECTGASSSSNTNEWADRIVQNISQKIPDFNEWANGVVSKVNSNVTGSLPDFNEWATSTSTAGVINDILLIAQELLVLHNDSTALPTSCKEIKERQPLSPLGVYQLAYPNTEGATYSTYCNMGTLCGSGGGWTRLAYLDMSDATQNCPSGFRLYQSGGVRACGRPATSSASCVSVQFPSNSISYSQICGRVTGYQYGSTDSVSESVNNVNSHYLDGVSITRGSPRQHVWSLYAGVYSDYSNSINICPCAGGTSPQSFVGNYYFCEAGTPGTSISHILYTSDPLWDGQGCTGLESSCCAVPGIPWFHRDYGNITTTDYIELRVCGDEGTNNDDAPVSYYEIYIK